MTTLSNADYVHLHAHGDTSFLDGRARNEEMVGHAVAQGHEAVSITDHDEVNAHIKMWQLCQAAGIKFIPGSEARWLIDIDESRKFGTRGYDSSHVILLAGDNEGLRNLWTLSSLAYEPQNFYGKPQLSPALMKQYSSGLWASDGCGLTRFAGYVEQGDEDRARQEWAVLMDVFGNRFYSELHTFHFIESEARPLTAKEREINNKITLMNQAKVRFAQEYGVPLVVVNDSHYAPESDWEQHRLVWKMNTKGGKDQVEGNTHAADWMMTAQESLDNMGFHGIPTSVIVEAIKNTKWIADQIDVEIKPTLEMPRLHPTDAEDAQAFRRACERGYRKLITDKGLPEDVYRPRLEREIKLITDQGMPGYFNIVSDYVGKARDGSYVKYLPGQGGSKPRPCVCGPGRGSGGGSLVNYLLGITGLDPIKYDLSFERFINPDRPDYPDIDVDFQKSHRKDLIAYMGARYGEDKVVAIGTKSKSGPAKCLQDLCTALKIPFSEAKAMSKLIKKVDFSDNNDYEVNPDYEPPSWAEVIETLGGELTPYVEKHPELFMRVEQMVGLYRQSGVHAAGIVVSTTPILGNVPTRRKGGKADAPVATQFDMEEVAWLGGVKDDFLSNKGLDVLAFARDMIWDRHKVWIDYDGHGNGVPEDCQELIDLSDPSYSEDPAIWEQIDLGHTAGIFQINTPSGTKQAMRFQPRSIQDLADLVAINRPGVLRVPGLLKSYLARRHGEEPVTYDHPLLEPILGRTMGILVYQEDLVQACLVLAGFTKGEGETLRKAIGKKKLDLMKSFEDQFMAGCLANKDFTRQGGNKRLAERIWQSMMASASYAFNKAHSVGYAMQAYQEIWVKHYYFDEFITGCLAVYRDDVKDGEKKTLTFVRECRRKKRPLLPPDVNVSGPSFTITDEGIRYGLVDIKGIGASVTPDILDNRPYTDMADYLNRTKKSGGWKKGVADNLVKIGAFDWTGQTRADLLEQYYYHIARMEIAEKKRNTISVEATNEIVWDKWRKAPAKYPRFRFGDDDVMRDIEIDLVGTFITTDPMERYIEAIDAECIAHPSDFEDYRTGERFLIGGQLTRVHEHMQRNNRKMAFLTVRWAEEDFEFLAFADSYSSCRPMLEIGAPVACEVQRLDGDSANLLSVVRLDMI